MISRALFAVLVAACGAREPAHTEAAPLPSASASASSASFVEGAPTVHVSHPGVARVGTMTVNGRLPPEIIHHVLDTILPRARACKPRSKSSDDDSLLVVHFIIDRQGNIDAVNLDESAGIPDPVANCVSALFESLHFPQPEGGIVTVVYPLSFQTP